MKTGKMIVPAVFFAALLALPGCCGGGETVGTGQSSDSVSVAESRETVVTHGEEYFRTDYDTDDTTHTDVFLEKLRNDGYYCDGKRETKYNVDGIGKVRNITPDSISDEMPDVEVFCVDDSVCFIMTDGMLYRFNTYSGFHMKMFLWDYDGNGKKDILSYYSFGSGIARYGLEVLNLTTGRMIDIWEEKYPYTVELRNGKPYVEGEELTYRSGVFTCGDLINKENKPF